MIFVSLAVGMIIVREHRQNIVEFFNSICLLRGKKRSSGLADKVLNILQEIFSSVKFPLYMNKLPTYQAEQFNAPF